MPSRFLVPLALCGALLAPVAAASAAPDPTAKVLDTCIEQLNMRCYDVEQVQRAYGVDRLHRKGIDGTGTTVAVIMSPTPLLAAGLQTQSKLYGLKPADLTVLEPAGPAGHPGSLSDQQEPNLDVQAVHAIAPGAKLLFLAVPTAAVDDAILGDAPLAQAVDAAVAAGADVISMSFGGLERRYPRFRAALARAARAGVPAFTGSGDDGVTLPGSKGRRTVYPASDPNVTAVGGTLLTLDRQGRRQLPDIAWGPDALGGASGGGVARRSGLPSWQRSLAGVVRGGRNYPDISMLAATSGSFLIFLPGTDESVLPIGGTSVATPLMAGIAALARQVAGRPLRDVNAALYRMAKHRARNGIADVVLGNNSSSDAKDGATSGKHLVDGYLAKRGYDLVTGLGTIDDASRFVPALARSSGRPG